MKYSEIRKKIMACIEVDVPVMIWGAPGCGKSSLMADVAHATHRNLYDIRMTSLEPPDLSGLARFGDGNTCTYTRPDILPPLSDTKAIIFLDEMMSARREMQPIAYQIAYDRRVGSHALPAGVRIAAASNRVQDHAISERMSSALRSRFAHYTLEPDAIEVSREFLRRKYDPRMAAFLCWRPSIISTFTPDSTEMAFACPRTWEKSAKMLSIGVEDHEQHAGIVGAGQAAQLMAFLRIGSELPAPQQAINNPGKTPVMTEPDQAYAMVCAVGSAVTPQNSDNAMTYLLRYTSAEYIVLGADVAVSMQDDPAELMRSPGWKKYCADPRILSALGLR
jgi:AAA domain (dynein-related subfamily)